MITKNYFIKVNVSEINDDLRNGIFDRLIFRTGYNQPVLKFDRLTTPVIHIYLLFFK